LFQGGIFSVDSTEQIDREIVKSKSIDRCSRDHRSAFSVAVAAEAETAAAVAIKQQ
jgi:hypothetical protein